MKCIAMTSVTISQTGEQHQIKSETLPLRPSSVRATYKNVPGGVEERSNLLLQHPRFLSGNACPAELKMRHQAFEERQGSIGL